MHIMSTRAFSLTRRDLRLWTGLLLFAYVAMHLANHALGLVSLAAAEAGLRIALRVWHSLPGTALLYGSVAAHFALAMLAIYERRTLRMSALQALRIWLGLGIPLLLIGHVAATRLGFELHGLRPDYARIIWNLWSSDNEGRQLALLVPGWVHGCLGLHFAFANRGWYARARLPLFGAALVLPVVAGLGFVAMGRELTALGADRAWLEANVVQLDAAQRIAIARLRDGLLTTYFVTIGLVVAAREVRALIERRRNVLVTIAYPQRAVQVPRGWSVLEASRSFAIPHVSACGGRARCSTCRVRVTSGADACPPQTADEAHTLERIGAGADIRLACQLRPVHDVGVEPVVDAHAGAAQHESMPRITTERELAVLHLDLHGWSGAATHPAHDTIYALRLYLELIDAAVTRAGGKPGPFAGGSITALFGLDTGPERARAGALLAAADIGRSLAILDARLSRELGFAADFGIRLHAGPAVAAEVGSPPANAYYTLGEVVLEAEKLLEVARSDGARFVASESALAGARLADAVFSWRDIEIARGRHIRVAFTGSIKPLAGSQAAQ